MVVTYVGIQMSLDALNAALDLGGRLVDVPIGSLIVHGGSVVPVENVLVLSVSRLVICRDYSRERLPVWVMLSDVRRIFSLPDSYCGDPLDLLEGRCGKCRRVTKLQP